MKNKLISMLTIAITTTLLSSNVYAINNTVNSQSLIGSNSIINEYEFIETRPEIIEEMKNNAKKYEFEKTAEIPFGSRSLSSKMALAFDVAGFNHVAEALDYSMLKMREEPKLYEYTSSLSNDIWMYSPDFRNVMVNFLNEAKSKNSYEYFKTTSINFNKPNASTSDILFDKNLKKQTDLFGTLHAVTINLGVVKTGLTWQILVIIEDLYDFKKEDYQGMLQLVNNIAYHEQELGLVIPYRIQIFADRPNSKTLPFGVTPW